MDTQSVRVIEMARKEYRECFFTLILHEGNTGRTKTVSMVRLIKY
jgi:hypothetical protein